ncbi:MAG: BlaI/MecI/CopY family transcriptional regulator [Lachnospiraceae bacterium]|nr:BlaI/MecI/CopY family transcriptional regulator [Lachnospiraceae bacterium]
MKDYSLGVIEARFADIIWNHAPLKTSDMVKLAEESLGWKRTTTYTVLKKLSDRGLFVNEEGVVKVLMTKEEFYARQSENYVEQSFGGSLPNFLTAFSSRHKLSDKEIDEILKIIEENR